jgi:uncharacterized protein (UPF0264 family)
MDIICPIVEKVADTGVDLIKVGLFHEPVDDLLMQLGEQSTQGVIIVLFADRFSLQTIENLIDEVADAGLAGIMLDTANKSVGSLRQIMSESAIQQFVTLAQERELITGLAGSLTEHDIFALSHMGPDYLGFRGALCAEHDRISSLSADCVKHIRALILEEEKYNGEVAQNRKRRNLHGRRDHSSIKGRDSQLVF